MEKELCQHDWIDSDRKIYESKCKKCGLYARQAVMNLGSAENVAPIVAPMMVDHQKIMIEELQNELLSSLFESASY